VRKSQSVKYHSVINIFKQYHTMSALLWPTVCANCSVNVY